ncbi:secreted RxLR effector protein 161-like protein [Salvia divinorum]|uniref:Secreted RxLR effector protein 161-like protein n=1 Tax=Salvia divinorum TaxID=28513 RepID=A0ABD1GRM3_SALDI
MFGSTMSWKSHMQNVVALSTTEAEYMALTEAVKESIWLKGMLGDFGIQQESVEISCDNNSAIYLTKHQTFHERSKHIDICMHFIRDEVAKGRVRIKKVSTEYNAANMLTKPLPVSKFHHCMELVNILKR